MAHNRFEDEDTLLLHDSEDPPARTNRISSNTSSVPRAPVAQQPQISDDAFQLITSYFDTKISALKNDLISGNDSLAKKIKKEASVKLKGEGNQIQFTFNSEIIADLQKLQKHISADDFASTNLISGLILKVNRRNKLIRIADKSPAGWSTVREYESDDLASDSDDEKRLRQAEIRALKHIKEKRNRPKPYSKPSATVSRPPPNNAADNFQQFTYSQPPFPRSRRREATQYDVCFECGLPGHWKRNCTKLNKSTAAGASSSK